jgi:hypothetical protein
MELNNEMLQVDFLVCKFLFVLEENTSKHQDN